MRVPFDAHGQAVTGLDLGHMFALLVHQEVGNRNRRFDQNLFGPAPHALFFQLTQDAQRHVVVRPQQTGAMTMRTHLCRGFEHPRTQTLTRHFHQAKAGNPAHLNARAVGLELFFHPLFNGCVVATFIHVDEVDDDQTGQIAQTQLAGDLIGGLKVGLGRRLFDRTFFRGPARVHVDGHQRLGHADHDVAARGQLHGRVEHATQIAFDLMTRIKGHRIGVAFHVLAVGRHDHLHEILGGPVTGFALNDDLVDLFGIKITDRPFDQVALFVDLGRGDGFQRQFADLFPQTLQIFVIAFDFGLGALAACGADDQACAFGHIHLTRNRLELLAVGSVGDLAGDATTACGVGHQHTIATGQAEVRGQGRTLVAAFFLDDLDQQDLTDLDNFLDFVALGTGFAHGAHVFGFVLIRNGFDAVILVGGVAAFRLAVIIVAVIAVGLGRVDRRVRHGLHRGRPLLDRCVCAVEVDGFHARDIAGGFFLRRLDRVSRGDSILRFNLSRLGLAAPAGAFGLFGLGLGFGAHGLGVGFFFGDQRLTVGDRDLVVIGVDFVERKETMTVAAIVHKRRLKRRFDPCYFC